MDLLSRPITTRDIPHQYLDQLYLVGNIPFKALQSDARVTYTLYIPSQHLNANPGIPSHQPRRQHRDDSSDSQDPVTPPLSSPRSNLPLLPLIVTIHGTSRCAESSRNRLIAFANEHRVAVLAPLFPTGIDHPNDLDNYKLLRYRSLHADTTLLQILDEVKIRWPGIDTEKVIMMGFSGGGQFVQRWAYLYPERLWAVSIGSPGRVTCLRGRSAEERWPNGLKDVGEIFDGRGVDLAGLRKVRVQMVVGGEDTIVDGGKEFWDWLEEKKREWKSLTNGYTGGDVVEEVGGGGEKGKEKNGGILAPPKQGRVDTLKGLRDDWEASGIKVQFDVVEGVGHDVQALFPTVLEFLRNVRKDI